MPEEKVVYYVLKEAISAELLRKLKIRIEAEETLTYEDEPDDPIACWAITKTGLKKLGQYGYQTHTVLPTGYEGILFVALANPDGTPARHDLDPQDIRVVEIHDWQGGADLAKVRELLEVELRDRLNMHVQFRDMGGARVNNLARLDRTITVYYQGSPEAGEWDAPPEIFGSPYTGGVRQRFALWSAGIPLSCPEGDEIAAGDPSVLCIYPRLTNSTNIDKELEQLRGVLRLYADQYEKGFDCAPDYDEIQRRYVKACSARVNVRKRELSDQYDALVQQLENVREKLTNTVREAQTVSHELSTFDQYRETMEERLAKEFQALLRIPRVKRVDWRGEFMNVQTVHMFCLNPGDGHMYDIGEFNMLIDSRRSDVKFLNQTRRVKSFDERDMNGPHLFPDGHACLGNMYETIPKLVATYQWSALIQVCLAFIESVNLDDTAGRGITKWPVALKKKEIQEIEKELGITVGELRANLGVEYMPEDLRARLRGETAERRETLEAVTTAEGVTAEAVTAEAE